MKKANVAIYIPNMDADNFEKICNEKGLQFVYVEVPEHGRLIDADALPTYDKPIGKMMMFGGEYVYTQTAIDNAPTIIPADKEGEG